MKTTKKDFGEFKSRFEQWRKRLGLMDWECVFSHARLDDNLGAGVYADLEPCLATVCLGFKKDSRPMSKTARHEALELLLSELWLMSQYRFVRRDELEAARHRVIRRLEALFDEMGME